MRSRFAFASEIGPGFSPDIRTNAKAVIPSEAEGVSTLRSRGTPAFVCALVFLVVASGSAALHAQTIQIKLVDGKTGHIIAHACAGVWMKNDPLKTVFIPTGKDGIAGLRLELEANFTYDPALGCGGSGAINPVLKYGDTLIAYSGSDNPSCAFPESMPKERWKEIEFSTREVLEHGATSANTCGKVAVLPQPGEVIVFVRPRNLREKIFDWGNSDSFPF